MPTTKRRWAIRFGIFLIANLLFTALLAGAAFVYGWASFAGGLPDLHGWHLDRPPSEFTAADATPSFTFDDYLAREDTVFKELDALISGPWSGEPGGRFSRFTPGSVSNPATASDRNWNRTYILESPKPIGTALLIHGLSDCPYSLRVLGQRLHHEGYTVVGLRLPGHGTCPAALTAVSWRDWAAAVHIAARGLHRRVPADLPFVMVGYSAGGALSVEYALAASEDPTLPRPDAIVLFSPMIGITSMAEASELAPLAARLSGQKKIQWSGVQAEADPYKYNSWPMNASIQAWRLTKQVEARLAAASKAGRTAELPPILAIQSAVDSTIVVPALITSLFDRLQPHGNALILFDVNRASFLENLLRYGFEKEIVPRLSRGDLPYSLTVVTNAGPDSQELIARTREAGALVEVPLGLSWPRGVFSLSHVALPISPDDPILGTAEATAKSGLPLGSIDLHGEQGVLAISESLMMRLRHNPFYSFTENSVIEWLAKTVGPNAPSPSASPSGSSAATPARSP